MQTVYEEGLLQNRDVNSGNAHRNGKGNIVGNIFIQVYEKGNSNCVTFFLSLFLLGVFLSFSFVCLFVLPYFVYSGGGAITVKVDSTCLSKSLYFLFDEVSLCLFLKNVIHSLFIFSFLSLSRLFACFALLCLFGWRLLIVSIFHIRL